MVKKKESPVRITELSSGLVGRVQSVAPVTGGGFVSRLKDLRRSI